MHRRMTILEDPGIDIRRQFADCVRIFTSHRATIAHGHKALEHIRIVHANETLDDKAKHIDTGGK
jgi:hypothetical protein